MGDKYLLPSSPVEPCQGRGGGETTTTDRKAVTTESGLITASNQRPPRRSFDTVEVLHFWNQNLFHPYTDERGSACCVDIAHPITGDRLWLGISHCKTPYSGKGDSPPDRSQREIQPVLFEPSTPWRRRLRTRSWLAVDAFCIGHATAAEARDKLDPLQIDRTYDCPRIHFVTGMAEVVDDPSSVIIAYGVNDCAPRFITVQKAHLVRLLFLDVLL